MMFLAWVFCLCGFLGSVAYRCDVDSSAVIMFIGSNCCFMVKECSIAGIDLGNDKR